MGVRVRIEKSLGPFFASDEELKKLSDEDIINIIMEDFLDFTDSATWEIIRDD